MLCRPLNHSQTNGGSGLVTSAPPTGILTNFNLDDESCNVTSRISSLVGRNLHLQPDHPIGIVKSMIEAYWKRRDDSFISVDDLSPIVSTTANFDSLLVDADHVSRSRSDTYYLTDDTVLRTHMTCHDQELLRMGHDRFLSTGDVYRRDDIDRSHYPVFHQMDGVKMFSPDEPLPVVVDDLKDGLDGMVRDLFGDVEIRWGTDYFPFTDPSFELEINFEGKWLEVLGCGILQPRVLSMAGRNEDEIGWAFGLGLERLAMVLFSIPDIRLFWTDDDRFRNQFRAGQVSKFQPYSKHPPCLKDVSFWAPEGFHQNDLNEVVRDVAGDLAEEVMLIDTFVHPKTNRLSNCFRISYRAMNRSLTNEEVDQLQNQVREKIVSELDVELR